MWMIWVLVAILSVTGYYSTALNTQTLPMAELRNENLANNMAVYRSMVVDFLARNPGIVGPATVTDAQLETVRPAWFTPSPLWANHLAADGMITIYATTLPPTRIAYDIVKLSQGSELAGEFNAARSLLNLFSPLTGDTGIRLPAGVAIPNGSPVWMASRRQS